MAAIKHNKAFLAGQGTSLVFIVGGLLMAAFWLIYTLAHGPTSFDQNNPVWGRTTLFWGSLLGGIPNLLLALGMLLLYPTVASGSGRIARTGYTLAMIGLVVPAIVDIVTVGLGPPLLMPLLGIGLILSGLGNRNRSLAQRQLFFVIHSIGILLLVAFAWGFAIPQDISDRVQGYRIFGLMGYFLAGLGWMGLGVWVRRLQSSRHRLDQVEKYR